jgi:hypothetical protein
MVYNALTIHENKADLATVVNMVKNLVTGDVQVQMGLSVLGKMLELKAKKAAAMEGRDDAPLQWFWEDLVCMYQDECITALDRFTDPILNLMGKNHGSFKEVEVSIPASTSTHLTVLHHLEASAPLEYTTLPSI